MGKAVRKELTIRRPGEEFEPEQVRTIIHSQRRTLMVRGYGLRKKMAFVAIPSDAIDGQRRAEIRSEGLNVQRYAEWIISGQLSPMVQELRSEERENVLVVKDGAQAHILEQGHRGCSTRLRLHSPPASPILTRPACHRGPLAHHEDQDRRSAS